MRLTHGQKATLGGAILANNEALEVISELVRSEEILIDDVVLLGLVSYNARQLRADLEALLKAQEGV